MRLSWSQRSAIPIYGEVDWGSSSSAYWQLRWRSERVLRVKASEGGVVGTGDVHYPRLDSLRGVAAQPVLFSHALGMLFPTQFPAISTAGWAARISVLLFFVLSGFVITVSIRQQMQRTGEFSWVHFAVRRFARIYPTYLLA